LQSGFPCQAEGAAVEFTLANLVFDQGFPNLPDTDVRIFHLPDLTALEGLHGNGLFLRRVLHGRELNTGQIQRKENPLLNEPSKQPDQSRAPVPLKQSPAFNIGDARRHRRRRAAGPRGDGPR